MHRAVLPSTRFLFTTFISPSAAARAPVVARGGRGVRLPAGSQAALDFGPFALVGEPPPADGAADGYAPRPTVLDAPGEFVRAAQS
jgi:hypothetical protein